MMWHILCLHILYGIYYVTYIMWHILYGIYFVAYIIWHILCGIYYVSIYYVAYLAYIWHFLA